jgi:hypothetical protein
MPDGSNTPSTRKMIKWTEEQRRMVAHRYIELCLQEGKDLQKHWGQALTIVEAQKVLPENLWRTQASVSGENNQRPLLDVVQEIVLQQVSAEQEAQRLVAEETERENKEAEAKRIAAERDAAEKQAAAPFAESILQAATSKPEDIGRDLETPSRKMEFRQPTVDDTDHFGSALEEMIHNLAVGIASVVVDQIVIQTKQAFLKELPKLATRALTMTKTLPKILVVGPLPKFQAQLEQTVEGIVELKFVSQEEGPSLVNLRGKSCVAAVIWTNFISHSHQSAVKKLFTDHNSRYVTGGIETLKACLEEVALQLPEPA